MELKRICGWCGIFLGGDPNAERVSHGICRDCLHAELYGEGGAPAPEQPPSPEWEVWQDEGGGG